MHVGSFDNFLGLLDGKVATASNHKINFFSVENFRNYKQEYSNSDLNLQTAITETNEKQIALSGRNKIIIYDFINYKVSYIINNIHLENYHCCIKTNYWFIGNDYGQLIVLDNNDKYIVHKNGHNDKIKSLISNKK